eukprot:1969520-Amphidinium_carterae.1
MAEQGQSFKRPVKAFAGLRGQGNHGCSRSKLLMVVSTCSIMIRPHPTLFKGLVAHQSCACPTCEGRLGVVFHDLPPGYLQAIIM